jgi:hypothetical protein
LKTKKLSVWLLFLPLAALSQTTTKSISLSDKSNVSAGEISKLLPKSCPNVTIAIDAAKADYILDATNQTTRPGLGIERMRMVDLTLHDRTGITVRGASESSLKGALRELCDGLLKAVLIDIVDAKTLTLSTDVRGDTTNGIGGALATSLIGRRTHTDATSIYIVLNGEHALLDCYEHRTGCATIAPGKYYGQVRGDGIWIDYEMPITHEPMRNHYKLAGSW